MLLLFSNRVAEWPPICKRAVIWFTERAFRERLSVCVSFPFDFEGGI